MYSRLNIIFILAENVWQIQVSKEEKWKLSTAPTFKQSQQISVSRKKFFPT